MRLLMQQQSSSIYFLILCFWIGAVFANANNNHRHGILGRFLHRRQSKKQPATDNQNASIRGGGLTTTLGPLQTLMATISETRSHLAAAAVARSSSLLACYPIDTVKTRIQTSSQYPFSVSGLYGGIGSCLFGQIPYAVITFGSYEQYKKKIQQCFPNMRPVFVYAIAAILGDLTGSGWLCPAEVVKQTLQAGLYPSTTQAVANIWKTQGGVRGFYRGYFASIARDVPFRVAQLTSYEVAKSLYLRFKKSRRDSTGTRHYGGFKQNNDSIIDLTPAESAIIGGIAGCISSVVTQPMDVLRTLMMTSGPANGIESFKEALQINGVRGVYRGLVPRLAYVLPSVTIFFVAYELTQQKLQNWQ